MNLNEMLISQYIDDELDLNEKLRFLEELAEKPEYSREAISLVQQEILLEDTDKSLLAGMDGQIFPQAMHAPPKKRKPALRLAGAMAAAACIFVALFVLVQRPPKPVSTGVTHRFVLYMPSAEQVAVSGSFNGWAAVPMQQPGHSGYWETVLVLPPGEHRFSYLVEQNSPMADPTILAKEHDGFGGMNSILKVERQI